MQWLNHREAALLQRLVHVEASLTVEMLDRQSRSSLGGLHALAVVLELIWRGSSFGGDAHSAVNLIQPSSSFGGQALPVGKLILRCCSFGGVDSLPAVPCQRCSSFGGEALSVVKLFRRCRNSW